MRGSVRRLRVSCSYPMEGIAIGASIACSGPCLTAVATGTADGRTWFDVDAGPETLERTTVGDWKPGRTINLERSLKIGDELGGHLVSGHVDGIATVVERLDIGETVRFDIEAPETLGGFIAQKGSISLDGTSLTVNQRAGLDLFGAADPAHPRGDDLAGCAGRRTAEHRGRYDGALCRAPRRLDCGAYGR